MPNVGDAAPADEEASSVMTTTLAPGHNNSLQTSSVGDLATRATFLSIFIIIGFMGNSVMVATVVQSRRLRKTPLNLLLVSAASVNIIDCLVNMPLVLGSTISESWGYGDLICSVNAAAISCTTTSMFLTVTIMVLECAVTLQQPTKKYKRLNRTRTSVIIVVIWIISIVIAIPLVTGDIPTRPFPARYLCSISSGAHIAYVTLTSILTFIVPLLFILALIGFVTYIGIQETLAERNDIPESSIEYSADENLRKLVRTELSKSRFVIAIFLFWFILVSPYLLLNYIDQYKNSQVPKVESVLLNFTYPWELDLAFTWMKFSFVIILPLLTALWRKEIWQRFKNFILCHKSNLIKDVSPDSSPSHRSQGSSDTDNYGDVTYGEAYKVPVLFATKQGLHYADDGVVDTGLEDSLDGQLSRKCDVLGSQFLQIDDDTSDYDSSVDAVDPYTESNAISVRSEYGRSATASRAFFGRQSSHDTQIVPFDPSLAETEEKPVKTKKKKSKRKDKIDVTIPEDDDVEEKKNSLDRYRSRTSSDSGRGSGDDGTAKRRKRRDFEPTPADDIEERVPTEKPRKQKKTKHTDVKEFEENQINDVEVNPKKKKKKDKKKIKQTPIKTLEDIRPPHRLQPLDHPDNVELHALHSGPAPNHLSHEPLGGNTIEGNSNSAYEDDEADKRQLKRRSRSGDRGPERQRTLSGGKHRKKKHSIEPHYEGDPDDNNDDKKPVPTRRSISQVSGDELSRDSYPPKKHRRGTESDHNNSNSSTEYSAEEVNPQTDDARVDESAGKSSHRRRKHRNNSSS